MFVTHEQARKIVDHDTVVVVVDTNRPSMTECSEILNQTRTIVVLDHHRQSSEVIKMRFCPISSRMHHPHVR